MKQSSSLAGTFLSETLEKKGLHDKHDVVTELVRK
jgi:hypothetical protein